MGTLMRNRQVVGGTPVVDTALDTQSEDVVQNKVVAQAISTINSKLHWKKVGEVIGKTAIQLPADFEEISVKINIGNNIYYVVVINIARKELGQNGEYFRGGHYTSSTDCCGCALLCDLSSVKLISAATNGSVNLADESKVTVYYR